VLSWTGEVGVIPLHVLTGFLGVGKTTLLSALLQDPRGERIAVLVNEVGELSIDHHLLERIEDDISVLPSGCICCTIQSELGLALERVLAHKPTRIVLETSGLADPAPILHGRATDPRLSAQLSIAGVIAVVDVARIDNLLQTQPEVRRQLAMADRVVLSKADLAPLRLAEARAHAQAAAPGCEVRVASQGVIDTQWLLSGAPLARMLDPGVAQVWLHHGADGAAYRSHTVQLPQPAKIELVQLWLRLVTQLDGARLLRIKGLVECAQSGDIFAVQSAEHALSPPRRLQRAPTGVRGVQMVLIERGLPDEVLAQVLATLREAVDATPAR
jgi:G3E family GTPase